MSQVVEAVRSAVPGLHFPAGVALPAGVPPEPGDVRIEVPIDQVSFIHAETSSQLRRIAHLREAIALPPAVREAPAFARLEKKETSWVS